MESDFWELALIHSREGRLTEFLLSIPREQWSKKDSYHRSLIYYISYDCDVDALILLAQHGLDINDRTYIRSPCHHFVLAGCVRILLVLCSLNANLKIRDTFGYTAVDDSLLSRNYDCTRVLLSNLAGPPSSWDAWFHIPQDTMDELRLFRQGVLRCRDIIVILLGLKKRNNLTTLKKLDRFLIKQVLAVEIWTTRTETQWQK